MRIGLLTVAILVAHANLAGAEPRIVEHVARGPFVGAFPDGALLTGPGPGKVYVMRRGVRHWIPNPETFNAMGFNWNAIRRIPWAEVNAIPRGPDLPSVR